MAHLLASIKAKSYRGVILPRFNLLICYNIKMSAFVPLIEYRTNFPIDPADVAAIFDASGIRRPTKDLVRIKRMLDNANLIVSAWYESKLIGVCRALTDFSYCCYISDLAVDKAFQRQGIGRELIARIRSAIGNEVAIILVSAPEAVEYYPKLGFEKIENGFIIKRTK